MKPIRHQNRNLTYKQFSFIWHSCNDEDCYSGAEAVRRAGYRCKPENARRIAYQLMQRPWIYRVVYEVERIMEERWEDEWWAKQFRRCRL